MTNCLIIDDDMDIRDLLAKIATELSCNVAVAESIEAGLKIACLTIVRTVFNMDLYNNMDKSSSKLRKFYCKVKFSSNKEELYGNNKAYFIPDVHI